MFRRKLDILSYVGRQKKGKVMLGVLVVILYFLACDLDIPYTL